MIKFLGILVIIIASFYVLGYIFRLLLPFLMARLTKKMMDNLQNGQNLYNQPTSKEGDVKIKYNSKQEKNSTKEKGEYVDYEEIE